MQFMEADTKLNIKGKEVTRPRFDHFLEALYFHGMKGHAAALVQLTERCLGKVPQPIVGAGEDKPPVRVEFIVRGKRGGPGIRCDAGGSSGEAGTIPAK